MVRVQKSQSKSMYPLGVICHAPGSASFSGTLQGQNYVQPATLPIEALAMVVGAVE